MRKLSRDLIQCGNFLEKHRCDSVSHCEWDEDEKTCLESWEATEGGGFRRPATSAKKKRTDFRSMADYPQPTENESKSDLRKRRKRFYRKHDMNEMTAEQREEHNRAGTQRSRESKARKIKDQVDSSSNIRRGIEPPSQTPVERAEEARAFTKKHRGLKTHRKEEARAFTKKRRLLPSPSPSPRPQEPTSGDRVNIRSVVMEMGRHVDASAKIKLSEAYGAFKSGKMDKTALLRELKRIAPQQLRQALPPFAREYL